MNPWLIEQMIRDQNYRYQWEHHWEQNQIRQREQLWQAWHQTQSLRAIPDAGLRRPGTVRRSMYKLGTLLADCGQWLQQRYPLPPCCPPAPPRSAA